MSVRPGHVLEFDAGARERRARLPFASQRVLKGARHPVLTDFVKLVWMEIHSLHLGPEGCYLAASEIADRLGRSVDGVEKARRLLKRLGLLWDIPGKSRGDRKSSWFAALPGDCIPLNERPKVAEVQAASARLDAYLTAIELAYHRTPITEGNGVPSGASQIEPGRQSGGPPGATLAPRRAPSIQQGKENGGERERITSLHAPSVRQNLQSPTAGETPQAAGSRMEQLLRTWEARGS